MRRSPSVTQVLAACTVVVSFAWPSPLALAAQSAPQKPAAPPAKTKKPYAPPRTPWGDPDLPGVYTNNDESGIPLERPSQFEGKKLEDVSESELEQLRAQREEQRVAIAPNLGGIPGTNPVHWFENFGARNSRAWLLVDPPDGRVPPRTDQAQPAAADRAAGAASVPDRSTAPRTSACTTGASRAAFPAR